MKEFDKEFKDLLEVEVEEPNFEEYKDSYKAILEKLTKSTTAEEAIHTIEEYFDLDDKLQTHYALVSIHNSIDTRDEKYISYTEAYDENLPLLEEIGQQISKAILESQFIDEITKQFGNLYIKKLKLSLKIFSPDVIELIQNENRLVSAYTRIVGGALIDFKGQRYSLSQMGKFCQDDDRKVRRKANEVVLTWWDEHDDEIGNLFDSLVKTRHKIATRLGYKNFIQLGYDRLMRTGWTQKHVKEYRAQVVENIVPVAQDILRKQKDRLGYGDDTCFYDYNLFYKSGNPKPLGNKDALVKKAQKMYRALNKEASFYFDFMVNKNCFDLEAKGGKMGGGYMCFLPCLETSFIFSNFNGTSGDVDVLTHEFGHALQGFLSKDIKVPSLRAPGYEVCEMHSMSMEFLTHPYMKDFFGSKADKYRYQHISSALTFIPYGTQVDHFQHFIYENPEITHTERKQYWLELDKIYRPHLEFAGFNFLKKGGWWMRQNHIFASPFYYIDYTIAQIVALGFLIDAKKEMEESPTKILKPKNTIKKYLKLCKLGGTKEYRKLLEACKIPDPMVRPNQKIIVDEVVKILNSYDVDSLDKK